MARLLFIFSLFGAIAIIGLLRGPGFDFDFFGTSVNSRTEETRSSAEPSRDAPAGATATAAGPRAGGVASRAAFDAPDVRNPSELSPNQPLSQSTRVVTDSIPVYVSNSGYGEVLRLLQEGDQVELGLEVLGPEGWWVEVRLDQETAGFMRRESLQRH